jgi:hypothetical protein
MISLQTWIIEAIAEAVVAVAANTTIYCFNKFIFKDTAVIILAVNKNDNDSSYRTAFFLLFYSILFPTLPF